MNERSQFHNRPQFALSQNRAATQRNTTQKHADIIVIKIVLFGLCIYAQLRSQFLLIGDHQRARIYPVNEKIQAGCGYVFKDSLDSQEGNFSTFQEYRIYIGGYRQGFS